MITRAECGIVRSGGDCVSEHSDDPSSTPAGANEVTFAAALLLALARLHRITGTTPLASLNPAVAARSSVRNAGVDPGDKDALERLSLAPWTEKSSESATPPDIDIQDPEALGALWDAKPGDMPLIVAGNIMPIPGEDYTETVARHYGVPVATPDPGESSESASRTWETPAPTPAVHVTVVVTTADSPDDVAQAIRDSLRDLRGLGQ